MPKKSFLLLKYAVEMQKKVFLHIVEDREMPNKCFLRIEINGEMPNKFFRHLPCVQLISLQIHWNMNNSKPVSPGAVVAAPIRTEARLDPVAALFALGSPVRWPLIKLLADGRTLSITEAAEMIGCTRENMGKQFGVLINAGVVDVREGEDRRHTLIQIPAARRPAPGVIDYGFCRIDLKQV